MSIIVARQRLFLQRGIYWIKRSYMFQRLNENKDLFIVAIASFFIGFGAASFFGGGTDTTVDESGQGSKIQDITLPPLPFDKETAGKEGQPSLVVENQRSGSSVVVRKAEFPEARWIVVQDAGNKGTAGNILGAGWFPAGTHENVLVPLLRVMTGGEQYAAVLYADMNGDKKFDHKTDIPVKNAAGDLVSISFRTIASPSGE